MQTRVFTSYGLSLSVTVLAFGDLSYAASLPAAPPPAVSTGTGASGVSGAGVGHIDPAAPSGPTTEPPPADLVPVPPAGPAAPELPVESHFGYDNGIFVRSRDKSYSLYINAFGQLQYALVAADGKVLSNGFHIVFGRIVVSGNLFSQKLTYFAQIDGSTLGNNNNVTMIDWWMKYTFSPYLYVLAGRWLVPYSRQFLTHPGNLLLPDLSPADYAFNLPRAIGVQLGGTAGRVSYDVFLVNSIRALGVGTQINRADSISGGGRIELAILKPYGYQESMPTPPAGIQLSVGVALAFNPVADASGFQNVEAGDDTFNLTTDVGFRWQRLTVQAAFYYRHLTNRGVSDSFGYYGQAGVYILRQRLELAARVSGALLGSRAPGFGLMNLAAGSPTEYGGGLNVYLFGHGAKLQTDYTYLQNDLFGTALFPAATLGAHRFRIQTQVMF